jgi:hypothetical protein
MRVVCTVEIALPGRPLVLLVFVDVMLCIYIPRVWGI